MYGCESWTVKKAEHWKIDAFELWCWRRLLRVPWTARRSDQSILKEISPGVHWKDWCWSWNSSTLATSCEELTRWKRPWCWEGLGVGGEGGDRGWDGWMASPTRWAWVWVNSRSWWWTGRPGVLRFMGSQSWTRLSDWTELKRVLSFSNRFFSNKLFLWRWFKHWDYLRTSSRVSKGLLVLCPKREVKAERLWAGNQSAVLLGQGRPRERPWGEELLTWPKALKSFVCLFSLVSFFCNILSSESFSVTLWICRIFKTFQLELTEWEFLQQLLHVMTMTMGLIIKSMCLVKRTMFILCMSYLLGT